MSNAARVDVARVDHSRVGVYDNSWDTLLKALKTKGCSSWNVTLKSLSLGFRDSVTGWYIKHYSESTIEAIILSKTATEILFSLGLWCKQDAIALTQSGVYIGDLLEDSNTHKTYDVTAIQEFTRGNHFVYRLCQLVEMPLFG
jgi:hypothetical protein